jgi:hypothetical protein
VANKSDKKISKSARQKNRVKFIQALIALLLVLGMVVTGIVAFFLK